MDDYVLRRGLEQVRHVALREPNGVPLDPDLNAGGSVVGLVEQKFAGVARDEFIRHGSIPLRRRREELLHQPLLVRPQGGELFGLDGKHLIQRSKAGGDSLLLGWHRKVKLMLQPPVQLEKHLLNDDSDAGIEEGLAYGRLLREVVEKLNAAILSGHHDRILVGDDAAMQPRRD